MFMDNMLGYIPQETPQRLSRGMHVLQYNSTSGINFAARGNRVHAPKRRSVPGSTTLYSDEVTNLQPYHKHCTGYCGVVFELQYCVCTIELRTSGTGGKLLQ